MSEKDSDRLRAMIDLELAEHKANEAQELLASAKADLRSVIVQSLGLNPSVSELDALRAQVSTAILLVVQADAIVKTTESIVSRATEAVEIARQVHLNATKKSQS